MAGTQKQPPTVSRLDGLVLHVTNGPEKGREIRVDLLHRQEIIFGRTQHACDVVLNDDSVSEQHFVLARDRGRDGEGEKIRLRDLCSQNGTWVGAMRVFEAWIEVGGLFRVGLTTLVLHQIVQREVRLWESDRFAGMLGSSKVMRLLFADIASVAKHGYTAAVVLMTGETGAGKERAAQAFHAMSPRAGKPFIPVNCAAIPEGLADSEFFGHIRGSFTGAISTQPGLFEAANGGRIFLDEIGELSLGLQSKLLRVIAEREVKKVGDSRRTHVDVQIIAATRRELLRMVEEGKFGIDLYYRICTFHFKIPSLREHKEDIPMLAEDFLDRYCTHVGVACRFHPTALGALQEHPWPGNVRELWNVVIDSAARVTSRAAPEILPDDLRWGPQPIMFDTLPFDITRRNVPEVLNEVERWLYAHVIERYPSRALQAKAAGKKSTQGFMDALGRLNANRDDLECWAEDLVGRSGCPLCLQPLRASDSEDALPPARASRRRPTRR